MVSMDFSLIGGNTMMGSGMMTPSRVLLGEVYTVEPGYDECSRYLSRPLRGGIGALSPMATKYYDYQGFMSSFGDLGGYGSPSLRDFVDMMDYVDEDVRFYCTADKQKVRECIKAYLDGFLTSAQAQEIRQIINAYLSQHSFVESGYKENIVVGTPFFNNLFYATSWRVAQDLFSPSAISSLQFSFQRLRGYDPTYSPSKAFVNLLDGGPVMQFFFDVGDGQCRMDDTVFLVSKDFHCSDREYRRSFEPYVLFLSTWSLMLACWMCMHEFGQCAFGLYWETGGMALLQKQQTSAWWKTHR